MREEPVHSLSSSLRLADNVFMCVSQGHVVFLDLDRDDYSAVPLADDDQGFSDRDLIARIGGHHAELLAAGLLTAAPPSAPAPTTEPVAIHRHIFGQADRRAFGFLAGQASAYKLHVRDIVDFIWSCATASRDLRTCPIGEIVRNARSAPPCVLQPATDLDDLKRQVAIFSLLRPWYPRRYLCLFEALALVRFLARRGRQASWIFGVKVQPFAAHCWVQEGSTLLNESLEFAGRFTPIMTV